MCLLALSFPAQTRQCAIVAESTNCEIETTSYFVFSTKT